MKIDIKVTPLQIKAFYRLVGGTSYHARKQALDTYGEAWPEYMDEALSKLWDDLDTILQGIADA